jgi:hypothetical protein
MSEHMPEFPSFLWKSIHSPVSEHLGCSVNNALMSRGVQNVRPNFNSFAYKPRSGIAGSYGGSIFNILRNCHIVCHTFSNIFWTFG